MNTQLRGPWIQTYTGRRFYPLDPLPEDVHIKDIAYVLAGEWRFGGHCRPRINVGQHSVLVSRKLEDLGCSAPVCLAGLLHDASEAFARDLNRPLKRELPEYRQLEERIQEAIFQRFDLPWPMPAVIHEVDNRVMANEAAACMQPLLSGFFSVCKHEPTPYEDLHIKPWGMKKTYRRFLHRFAELDLLRHAHVDESRHNYICGGVL